MSRDHDTLLELARGLAEGEVIDWDRRLAELEENTDVAAGLRRLADLQRHFDPPARDDNVVETAVSGEVWGHLRVRELLGEGSFGEVFRADDPVLRRQVALKLRSRSAGGASDGAFLAEARRLARVRHPNVLAVHGADVHDGRAGLWADLLNGRTLEEHLSNGEIFPPTRVLAIARQVAEALEAVHGAGLVHGDVKASNVILEPDGRAVLMDFGAGSDTATHPPEGPAVGSPLSMAPELFGGRAASLASDLYSTGVLFFRLLVGRYPVEAETLQELENLHLRGTLPRWRAADRIPRSWRRLIDTLLAPEANLRPDASELVARLRAIADLPGQRRRRFAVASVISSLLIALGASSVGWWSARRSTERAVAARTEAEATSTFLSELLLAPDITQQGPDVRVLDVMDEARLLAEASLAERDLVRGRILFLIGRVQASLGRSDEGLDLLYEAEAAFAAAPEARARDEGVLAAVRRVRLLVELGRLDRADTELAKVEPRLEDPSTDPDLRRAWLRTKAYLATERGNLASAEAHYREALRLPDEGSKAEFDRVRGELAIVLETSGRLNEAEPLYRQNLETSLRRYGERHDSTLAVRHNLAGLLAHLGRYAEAEDLFRANVETAEDWLGRGHRIHLTSLTGLANVIGDQGRLQEASELDDQAFPLAETNWGEDHPRTQILRLNAANRRLLSSRPHQAEDLLRLAARNLEDRLGPGAPPLLYARMLLAQLLVDTGRASEAARLAAETLERARKSLGEDSPIALGLETRLGRAWTALGRAAESVALLASALDRQRRILGEDAIDTLFSQIALAEAEEALGHSPTALDLRCDAMNRFERTLGAENPHSRAARGNLDPAVHCRGSLLKDGF